MSDDNQILTRLNEKIGEVEDACDFNWLNCMIASGFAFRRANGSIVDKQMYIQKIKDDYEKMAALNKEPEYKRSTRIIEPIEIYGERAIVKCIVSIKDKEYHNIRLFVKGEDGGWKLLGWANEMIETNT